MPYDAEAYRPNVPAGWSLLLKLADHLDTVKPARYSQKTWRSGCGTVCCALGHAADQEIGVRWIGARWIADNAMAAVNESYCSLSKLSLAEQVFNLSDREARSLFGSSILTEEFYGGHLEALTPKLVATRIRQFVNAKIEALIQEEVHGLRR